MSKFDLILGFKAVQFRNEATYRTPQTNFGSIEEECMSSQNVIYFGRPFSEKLR